MSLNTIPFGKPEKFNVIIENSKGSHNKYEIDEPAGLLKLDFVFSGDLAWPANYGYIPNTLAEDGDALDALVISSEPLLPLSIAVCKPIAMVELLDRGLGDNKIIAVPIVDPMAKYLDDLQDLSEEQQRAFEDFYREVAIQKNKIVEIKGFHGKQRAVEEIKKSLKK